ncbi:MAG: DNA polymerase III subunit gamma/tau [Alphaproteobacteria bacterium]|nr:MAG: DNA polymerase III subunit gamma/tau [Alphaproteobacteria bacterium]
MEPDTTGRTADKDGESRMSTKEAAYRVLARKYRPQSFDTLIGQEAMVKTLANAIASGRIAHAFLLTGVRGVGKTTTARLIARALNCVGADGTGGPTTSPCGVCDPCVAIAESRHVDVIEMDAASHTGVDNIREIIDSVAFAPAAARFKVYIIDEVHMLSKGAFNALLKTLEEPPEHVKFIFATTEIRKVPVTILSRCQRFDLRRVDADMLVAHLTRIAGEEKVEAGEAALRLIARAAEGSVRDALSLLDQAIAHGGGTVEEASVRDMLGLADRGRILDLARAVLAGKVEDMLALLREQYDLGVDPAVVIGDLLETVHWLTRLKLVPESAAEGVPGDQAARGREMAEKLAMADLTRAWQMLLKGLSEVRMAPSPIMAAEMVLIRLAYAADLPSPAEAVRALTGKDGAPPPAAPTGHPGGTTQEAPSTRVAGQEAKAAAPEATMRSGNTVLALRRDEAATASAAHPVPADFAALVRLFHAEREPVLATMLKDHVRLVDYRPGRLTIHPTERAAPDLAHRVRTCLERWTGRDWQIVLSSEVGEASLREKELAHRARLREEALAHPLVRAVMERFPGATLSDVRERDEPAACIPGESGDEATSEEDLS